MSCNCSCNFSIALSARCVCCSAVSVLCVFVGGNIFSYSAFNASLRFRRFTSRSRSFAKSSSGFNGVGPSTGFSSGVLLAMASSSASISLSSNSKRFRAAVFAVLSADFNCPSRDSTGTGSCFLSLSTSAIKPLSIVSGVARSNPVAFGRRLLSRNRRATSLGLTPSASHFWLCSIALFKSLIFKSCLNWPLIERIFTSVGLLGSVRYTPY